MMGIPGAGNSGENSPFSTIRLLADVLARFLATGSGWQTRINAALKEELAQHPQA